MEQKKVIGVSCLHVNDLFMASNKEFSERVIPSLRRDFQVRSGGKNDIRCVGQCMHWIVDGKPGPHIRVVQDLCSDAPTELPLEKGISYNGTCPPRLHTASRSSLGQISWLQPRTQYHCC